MKKNIFLSVIIIIFIVVFYHGITDAQVTPPLSTIGNGIPFKSVVFGGKIEKLKANEVSSYEDADYECEVPGSTIEIRPVKSGDTSYFIPIETYPRTRYSVNQGQSILGRSSGTQTISCKKCQEEEKCVTASFTLPIITLFGTSRY